MTYVVGNSEKWSINHIETFYRKKLGDLSREHNPFSAHRSSSVDIISRDTDSHAILLEKFRPANWQVFAPYS